MNEEMEALNRWVLTELPLRRKPIGFSGSCLYLLVYVDDIILTRSNTKIIDDCKLLLKTKLRIKDLGHLKYFLGIELLDNNDCLVLPQRKYCLEVISEFDLLGRKPAITPLESGVVFSNINDHDSTDSPPENISEYQKCVGKLIYITLTRHDIAYVVHRLSQFMHAPLKSLLKAAFRVLRYLKGRPGKGVTVKRNNDFVITAFVDSDYAKGSMLRKSVTSFCIFLRNNLISWKSKKQSTVSRSSAEVGYRALTSCMWYLLCFPVNIDVVTVVVIYGGGWWQEANGGGTYTLKISI
ncbi:uncharacterized mitochondrial protein AtMg00810-like [Rutidosis leptorrhynchoides]|uniref:uncharacterized mitochondrial protein AtMg00810-like n=1 Tax=Rutidosis leptorrhynchoides TaxID=125765 RepID=UPI003A99C4AB